jgi:hypothetical protein
VTYGVLHILLDRVALVFIPPSLLSVGSEKRKQPYAFRSRCLPVPAGPFDSGNEYRVNSRRQAGSNGDKRLFWGLLPACASSAQNRNNSGKRISTTLYGSHSLDRCLLRLALVNNRI